MTTMSNTARGDYADVNGVHMYYELHGEGSPLMLIHGGMLGIDINFAGLISTLAQSHLSSQSSCKVMAAPPILTARSPRPT